MRRLLLLLLLPMTTGSQLIKGCQGGGVFFNYTEPDDQPLTSAALNCINSTERIRINKDGKNVTVEIIRLEKGDEKMCSLTMYLQVGDDCKEPITLAPRRGKVPVKCDDYTDESNEGIKYLCKAKQFDCEEISPKTMSIPVQTDNDYGSYWCGLKFSTYRVLFQEVSVINIPLPSKTMLIGGNLSYTCNYSGDPVGVKYICVGDLHECRYVLNTSQQQVGGRYEISNQAEKQTLTITIRKLESKDTGEYWCYTMRNKTRIIHNKFNLTVDQSHLELPGSPFQLVPMVAFAGVLLVVLVSLLVAWKSLSSRNTTEGHKQEEVNIYEEIQQRPRSHNSIAVHSIYVTATHPSTALPRSSEQL